MKGRHFLHIILLGMLMYFLIDLHYQYPYWYKNEIVVNICKVLLAIILVLQILGTIFVIILIIKGEYKYAMDDIFWKKYKGMVWFAICFCPLFLIYESIARFLDKHFTIKKQIK